MRIATILFLAFFSLGAATPSAPTFNIQGVVSDSTTRQPIPGAAIRLYSTFSQLQKSAVTDSSGRYALNNISLPQRGAAFIVSAAKNGYEAKTIRRSFSARGATYVLNFSLKPSQPRPPQPPQTIERIYINFNGQRVAMEEDGKKYFYHNDHLGSTSAVSDETGQKVKSIEYKPYGGTKNED